MGSNLQYDYQFEEELELMAIFCVQNVGGGPMHIVNRSDLHMRSTDFVHTPHAYGIDPNCNGFISKEMYNYRNLELGLNLNAQFYFQ